MNNWTISESETHWSPHKWEISSNPPFQGPGIYVEEEAERWEEREAMEGSKETMNSRHNRNDAHVNHRYCGSMHKTYKSSK